MKTKLRADIVECCLSMDTTAFEIYKYFEKMSKTEEHSSFWQQMAIEEKEHISFWEYIYELTLDGQLTNIFFEPDIIFTELSVLKEKVEKIKRQVKNNFKENETFFFACKLESVMLYPAFEMLFRSVKSKKKNEIISISYNKHIDNFIKYSKKHAPDSKEQNLIYELLKMSWNNNRNMVHQIEQIKTLREFVPICSHCRKIRDDKGYWEHLEIYFHEQHKLSFSHTVCPECIHEHYPVFEKPKKYP